MINSEFIKTRYNTRNTDIENNCNEKTKVKICIHIGNENNFDMKYVMKKKIIDLEKVFPETYLNIIHFGNEIIEKYLEEQDIKFFVPFQPPTYDIDIDNNVIEICYYHDQDKYNIMYMEDEDWVNVQIIGRDLLEELYQEHYMYVPNFNFKYYIKN